MRGVYVYRATEYSKIDKIFYTIPIMKGSYMYEPPKIVGLLVFGGAIARHLYKIKNPEIIVMIAEWISNYIEKNLKTWMHQHGNWAGFYLFYELKLQHNDNCCII